MFDLVSQFPIEDESASMKSLQDEALEESRAMAVSHGYAIAGSPSFEVLELPLGWYLQCLVPVEALDFGGGRSGE